jgi:hypothetical protein
VPVAIALVGCNVYDASLPPPGETPDGGTFRDADNDVRKGDGAGSADGAGGGGAGGSGGTGNTGGTGGTGGTGARDAGGGEAGRDADSGGTGGQDAERGDAGGDSGGAAGRDGGDSGNGNTDASEGGFRDVARDCNVGCIDASVDAADGIVDQCPSDPLKTAPGACGCGTPDTDSDTDGAADCIDGCPTDVRKTQPGICGCNADDPSDRDAGQAFCIKVLLAHRYSFNGTGTVATDSIAAANGNIMGGSNATLSGGYVNLSGDLGARYTSEGYVQLPSNLLTPLTNATLEVWVTWRGTGSSGGRLWQRFFDFGNQVASGSELIGGTYLFLTPNATSSGLSRVTFSTNGSANETFLNSVRTFPLNAQAHVVVVADDASDTLSLYLNGDPEGSVAWTGTLAGINGVNSWLGRSNYGVDPELNGQLHEFRIYRAALTAAQIRASYLAGPDPPFF